MAANLSAKFRLIDEMSDKIDNIARKGQAIADSFTNTKSAADSAFGGIEGGSQNAVSSVDGVARSIAQYSNAANNAASATGDWTEAVGSYDKSALEAIYTTEELVSMGLKSSDALEEQRQMMDACAQAVEILSSSMQAASGVQEELNSALEASSNIAEQIAENDNVSAQAKEDLAKASEQAAEAMNELKAAQQEADAAMSAYDATVASGTTDLHELEAAAQRAVNASENLMEANKRAANATEELGKASDQAGEEAEKSGTRGSDAVTAIASALAAAGITAELKQIATAAYELADSFSEAEKIVVNATGATGDKLRELDDSMMSAFSGNDDDLKIVAETVGELNTRLGYTGEHLTDVTGKFLDFADITGGNAANSVKNVTKIMNQWDIEAQDMEGLMDKLAYAGQKSGISIEQLSSTLISGASTFQNAGLDIDNTIKMLSDFELAGMNSTTAITAMRTAVNKFSSEGLDANMALQQTIEKISTMENKSEAMSLAIETFGQRAGGAIYQGIQKGIFSIDTFTGKLDGAKGTLAKTAEAGESLSEKWQKSNNAMSAAFSGVLEPALHKTSAGFADLTGSIGKYLQEHPVLAKFVAALAVGVGTLAAAIAGYTFATQVAIPAITTFGTTLNTALGPVGWITMGITAVTTALAAFAAMSNTAEDDTAGMTASTRAQYEELQKVEGQYQVAVDKYGETSEEALKLKYDVDKLSESFESNRQTIAELCAEVDDISKSVSDMADKYHKGTKEINDTKLGTLALIQKYQELSSQAHLTVGQQMELDAINSKLAKSFPEVAEAIKKTQGSAEDFAAAMRNAAEQQAKEQDLQNSQEAYVKALAEKEDITNKLNEAQKTYNEKLEEQKKIYDEIAENSSSADYSGAVDLSAQADIDKLSDTIEELTVAQQENDAVLAEINAKWERLAEAQNEAANASITYQQAAGMAYQSVQADIQTLCEEYDEAYNAALTSFQGQFGLFEQASMSSEEYMNSTVQNAQNAMNSQLEYWNQYTADIQTLKSMSASDLGITQENYNALMSYVQSGSEQAAGLAKSMVDSINSGNTDAVAKLGTTVGEVQAKQQEASATVADWKTNFNSEMDAIQEKMKTSIDNMKMTSEAAASAKSTIDSYINSIKAGASGAATAAKSVADSVAATLAANPVTVNVKVQEVKVPGHAKGTTSAESVFIAGEKGPELIARKANAYANGTTDSTDYYIAGENGPELIVGQQGSTVFPSEETDRLIDALNYRKSLYVPIQSRQGSNQENTGGEGTDQTKHIVLEIAGSGEINAGNSSKESVLEIMQNHIKPVLMNIIQSEIYEEGDLSYDY